MNDLKFFTNEPDRTLSDRFANMLRKHTQFWDVLVGYFRTSGFFRMYPTLEEVEHIRILVGLNVDRFTVKIIDRAREEIKYSAISAKQGSDIIKEEIENEFNHATTSEEVEQGVRVFIEWLKSGKLEMRMYTAAPIHAKVYIARKDPEHSDTFGSVVTGSSNFSEAGLLNNLEFNVELKDYDDVQFALTRFEELWAKGVDITEEYIDTIQNKTWMRNDLKPYDIYLKTLYEFFKEEINADKENFASLLPEGYMRLQYQSDAVTQAWKKLEAYNGVFISDVVGLGKTYICAMLANRIPRQKWKLFICPPVLVDYWKSVLQEFDVSRYDVVSLGKLDSVIDKGTEKYSYVFVDEAHRFRNSGTNAYTMLHQICRGKKTVLISATPINNYTTDIENQMYLFQNKQSGTINGIRNLDGFFRGLDSQLNKFPKGTPSYFAQLRANSEIIRDKLLREIMIRRTRSEIQQYYAEDLQKKGLTFPKVGSPEKIIYTFDDQMDETFTQTINQIKAFTYSRYMPLIYLKDQKKYATLIQGQKNVGGFMKGILVKRLESSFYAFRQTINRFIDSYEQFIAMMKTGTVYIGKGYNIYDMLDSGDTQKLVELIDQGEILKFKTTEFSTAFSKDLRSDLAQLETLRDWWDIISEDPKLTEFRKQLQTDANMKGHKIIVFTESMETADYLTKNLTDLYGDRIVCYSGQSSAALKTEIEDSFNPKNIEKGNDRYDMLITTDVLAEGINLHRANVLVNYDLPWNPTRIMQRVGRINRVGTSFDRIYVYNFFPTAQSKKHLPLEERILEKLQGFHDTLGEDFKYLSDQEEVSAKKLFDDLNSDLDNDNTPNNPELAYLAIIRAVRDNDPALFEHIKRLPSKIKAGRNHNAIANTATITFLRKGALKTFYKCDGDEATRLSFMEAIPYIECTSTEAGIPVGSDFYTQFRANDEAFDAMVVEEETVTIERPMVGGNDAKVIRLLKGLKNDPRLTDDQEDVINHMIDLWEAGEIPAKISKDVLKIKAEDTIEFYYKVLEIIPDNYLEDTAQKQAQVDGEKQIILSMYLQNGGH